MTIELSLQRWLHEHGQDVDGPLTIRRIGAGQSNVTSLITDAAARTWVLRRPPAGPIAATAHDMGREARVIAALRGTSVPVPAVIGTGELEGRPFFVMSHAPGVVLADEGAARALDETDRQALSDDVVAVLAGLHGVDPVTVDLADLGRADGYVDRQLRRLSAQWQVWADESSPTAAWVEVHDRLGSSQPRQQRGSLVHGDFRLSNLLVERGAVSAVLDWELCALGDPLADLGWLIDDWRSPTDLAIAIPSPTRAGGFRAREEIAARYAELSGLDLSELSFYRALSHWRAAGLLQGVLHRMRNGVVGRDAPRAASLGDTIALLLAEALELLPARAVRRA